MRPIAFYETAWRRRFWLGLLIAASAALSMVFTCITPFAAFAVIGATSSGIAIGAAAVLGTLVAHWTVARLGAFRSSVQVLAAFVPAFALYQLTLYAVAVSILGGTAAFVPEIVGRVFLVNAVTLVGLYGLNRVAAAARYLTLRGRAEVSPARFASR
jgi:hypothetical protein